MGIENRTIIPWVEVLTKQGKIAFTIILLVVMAAPLVAQIAPAPEAPPAASVASQLPSNSHSRVKTTPTATNPVGLFFVVRDPRAKSQKKLKDGGQSGLRGRLAGNLTKSDCTVTDDNVKQQLQTFSARTQAPITLGLLLDTSMDQQGVLPVEQQASASFLRGLLQPQDEAFVISFDVTVDMLADFTGSPRELQHALDRAQINSLSGNYANGTIPSIGRPKGALLYDAVYLAAHDKLGHEAGRKVLILLTNGRDDGSRVSLHSAIEAAQKANATVYILLIADPSIYGILDYPGASAMHQLAEATGGQVFRIGNKGRKMQAALQEITSELRTQYQASYTASRSTSSGDYRHVQVHCQQNGKPLRVQVRPGYYAVRNNSF